MVNFSYFEALEQKLIRLFSFPDQIEWHKFDWKTYVEKDVQKEDLQDPISRFSLHLLNSNKIGVNRTIPDLRYTIFEHYILR